MDAEAVRQLIATGMPDAEITVSGADGVHFEATVVSEEFSGQSKIRRHRVVYATLGSKMGNEIHALSLRTLTPQEAQGKEVE